MRWVLPLAIGLISCRGTPASPTPIAPAAAQPRQQPPLCTPDGPESCNGRCGIVDAGCDQVLACPCAAGATCRDGRCESRDPPLPPREDPPPRTDTETKNRTKPRGKCSCCHHHGGALLSDEQRRAKQAAFRQCIDAGGACESNCPVPP